MLTATTFPLPQCKVDPPNQLTFFAFNIVLREWGRADTSHVFRTLDLVKSSKMLARIQVGVLVTPSVTTRDNLLQTENASLRKVRLYHNMIPVLTRHMNNASTHHRSCRPWDIVLSFYAGDVHRSPFVLPETDTGEFGLHTSQKAFVLKTKSI